MNQIKIISIFLLVVVLFFSCEKEEEKLLANNDKIIYQTASLSSNPSSCGYIDELCNPCELIAQKLPDYVLAFQVDQGGDDDIFYRITPINLLEESTEFFIETSNNESFILTNTTNEFINQNSLHIDVPSSLRNLYRLDFEKLISNSYTDLELQQDLHVAFVRDSNNKILVNVSNFVDVDDDVQARPLDPCKGQYFKTLEMYRTELNMPDIISGSASTWMSLVDPVFNDCAGSVNLDYECVDSRCIIDGLINLETYNWTDSQLKALKTNYLSLLLDLNETESLALSNANAELINELYETSECGILTFCPSVVDQNEVLEDILKSSINLGLELNLETFQTELNKHQHIKLKFINDCPKMKCLWENFLGLLDVEDGDFICESIESFQLSENLNLTLFWDKNGASSLFKAPNGSYDEISDNPASTINRPDENDILIAFHRDICDDANTSESMEMAAIMFHELIHAEFYSWIREQYPNQYNYSLPANDKYPDNLELWLDVLQTNLDQPIGSSNQHNVMLFFIEEIQNSLWRLNGMIGNPEDYLFWAYKTINALNFNLITQQEYDDSMALFNTNVLGANNGTTNTGCDD